MQKLSPQEVQNISDAIDKNFDKQLQFTADLVKFPSTRGQEKAAQDFMHSAFEARDLVVDRWTIDVVDIKDHPGFSPVVNDYSQAINVVASHLPNTTNSAGQSLILNGHIDVVPTGPIDMWKTDPFNATTIDGWIHGRGAGDMKAGLAINLFAFDAIKDAGLKLCAPVYLQSVCEEECTGNGALSCLVRGYHADAALISEPMNEKLVRANVGVIWFELEVRGRPAHVLEAGSGANAITAIYHLIEALQQLEDIWNSQKTQHLFFEDSPQPISINVGKISGGDWASSVPAWCKIEVRAGIYPGISVQQAQAEIEQTIEQAATRHNYLSQHKPVIRYNGFTSEGYVLEPGGDAENCLREAHATIFQKELRSDTVPAYLDGRVFVLYDKTPALVYGPICERLHGFDERVNIESIRETTKTIALFMAQWCNVERR